MQGLEVRQVAQPLRNPPPKPRVVRQVQVLQTVQVAEALRHFPLNLHTGRKGREEGRDGGGGREGVKGGREGRKGREEGREEREGGR